MGTNHCVRHAGFHLRRYISEGAFGVTYTACKGRGTTDCSYVVKLFQGDTDASARREVRLAKIAGQFGVSPQVFAGGMCRGARTFQQLGVKRDIKTKIGYSKIYYITMEYFGSMTLAKAFKRKLLTGEQVKEIYLAIADAVKRFAQHNGGWLHVDLHFNTILIKLPKDESEKLEWRIIDWGRVSRRQAEFDDFVMSMAALL